MKPSPKMLDRLRAHKVMTTAEMRMLYSENDSVPLDRRTFNRYLQEAGIKPGNILHRRHKMTPQEIKKFTDTHGYPETI